MTNNSNTRDIIREQAAAFTLLGDEYETTLVGCEPGDSAVRITKQGSQQTLYIVAYSDPDDTEMMLYDEDDSIMAECTIYNGALDNFTAEDLADDIRKFF